MKGKSLLLVIIPVIVVLGCILTICVIVGLSGSSGTPVGTQPEKVSDGGSSNSNNDGKKDETKVFKINDQIKLGDYVIQVSNLVNPYKSSDSFSQPSAGNKYIAVEVSYTNNTKDKTIAYNPFDWKLFDSDGYTYDHTFFGTKEPSLSSGDLNPNGSKVKGWLTFQVPSGSKNYKLQFTPNFWSNDNVEIQLY